MEPRKGIVVRAAALPFASGSTEALQTGQAPRSHRGQRAGRVPRVGSPGTWEILSSPTAIRSGIRSKALASDERTRRRERTCAHGRYFRARQTKQGRMDDGKSEPPIVQREGN